MLFLNAVDVVFFFKVGRQNKSNFDALIYFSDGLEVLMYQR